MPSAHSSRSDVLALLALGLAGCPSPQAPAAPPMKAVAVDEPPYREPPARSPLLAAAPAPSACVPADWSPRKLPPLLRSVPTKSVDLDAVMNQAERSAIWERSVIGDSPCSDNPGPAVAPSPRGARGEKAGVEVRVLDARDAGKSGRGWAGYQCTYGVSLADGSGPLVTLGAAEVPPFNELTAIEREGSAAFLAVQFNGYAREARGGSNRLVAVDLCEGQVKWTSRDLIANGPILLIGDYLVSTYGFTAEPDFVYVHNAKSGELLQKLPTPSAGEKMWLKGDVLVVQTYDSFVAFKVAGR